MAPNARTTANRENAKKSTGPITKAGKDRSRQNALKHGLTSIVIAMPDEDPQVFADRLDDWQAHLNPNANPVDGYLVTIAFRTTLRLDRCDLVHNARAAKLARDAIATCREERLRTVDECSRLIVDDPDIAVRRLKLIPEGIDFLISAWDRLRTALIGDPPHWDVSDQNQFMRLKGIRYREPNPGPCPTALCTLAIAEHREVKAKLSANERLEMIYWALKYSCEQAHQFDRDRYPELEANGRGARDELIWLIGREVDGLRTLQRKLIEDDQVDRLQASYRARFDASDDGKLLHRYEEDLKRGMMRTFKELRDRAREAEKSTQVDRYERDTTIAESASEPSPARPAQEARSRNKANSAGGIELPERPNPSKRAVEIDGKGDFCAGRSPKNE